MKKISGIRMLPLFVGAACGIMTTLNGASHHSVSTSGPVGSTINLSAEEFIIAQTRRVRHGDHWLILKRVEPPVFKIQPSLPQPAAFETGPSAEPAVASQRAERRYEILLLVATVYDRKLTEVRWSVGAAEYCIISNIDFNHLLGCGDIETSDAVFIPLLSIANESVAAAESFNQRAAVNKAPRRARKQIVRPGIFSRSRAEYIVVENGGFATPSDGELEAIEAIHVFYDLNRPRLATLSAQREAAADEQESWRSENPPVPLDTEVHYWFPQDGSGDAGTKATNAQ